MTTDKSWIRIRNRRSPEFLKGLNNFMEIAEKYVDEEGKVCCPCRKCVNMYRQELATVYAHIHDRGFLESYMRWTHHGEECAAYDLGYNSAPRRNSSATNEMFDVLDDVMAEQSTNEENIDEEGTGLDPEFDALFEELNTELFPDCSWMSSLNFLAKLMHIKVINRWTDSSVDQILELLRISHPKPNKVPASCYEAKKKLRKIGLGYQSIHACVNDCALFWKDNVDMQYCPVCNESRWVNTTTKGKKVPQKVLRYFPLASRLRRMYSSRFTAKDMIWHNTGRSKDGMMRHPVDGKAWQEFDKRYPEFSKEPRNVRLGLAADGFNPFSNFNNAHSTWPVILTTYNTPPWICMKESSLMLTLLIPGPRSPSRDIDVYLRPLVDELKTLWADGVLMRDASTNTIFSMHAALLWTINDFQARSILSGWSGQGYLACPTCNEDTSSIYITKKMAYLGHRRFLPMKHKWRDSLLFNGEPERRPRPRRFSKATILKQLDRLPNRIPGKRSSGVKRSRHESELNWTKRSIFFELDYWSSLDLKHNLDVMHVEKNVCESLLNTLLMNENTKDKDRARKDLENRGIRQDQWLQEKNNKDIKPHPPYSFKPNDRQRFCRFIKGVRLPDGFGSNFKKKVHESETNLVGLKSHDYHILMQRLLPIGARAGLASNVSTTIIDLCTFFRKICARSLDINDMRKAQEEMIKILCNLELIYPPAFFDIMIHLVLHLPEEAILGGPVYMRWMYPFERYMKSLKNYVRNKAKPEGSIAEGYVANEALTFCSMYLEGVKTKFNRVDRNADEGIPKRQFSVFSSQCRAISSKKIVELPEEAKKSLHWFVLNKSNEINNYISEFKSELPESDVKTEFPSWFDNKIYLLQKDMTSNCTDELKALAYGPVNAYSYTGCIVNGVRFVVHSRDLQRTTQNSGVVTLGEDGTPFYGQLEDIIELHYLSGYSVVLFRCKWFNTSSKGREIKKNNILVIDISHEWYVGNSWYDDQQYILATQAKQVFYLQDPSRNSKWRVVEEVHHRKLWDHPSINVVNEIDVVNDTRSTDFTLVVDLSPLPMRTTLGEVGESSVATRKDVAPVINDEDLIDHDDTNCLDDEEINNDNNNINDDIVDVYCSSDDSD